MMNFNCVLRKSSNINTSLINYQSVRWRRPRKPFWLGVAKTKMFVVPESRIKRTKEEWTELHRLEKIYNTQMKSLRKFIKQDNPLIKNEENENALGSEKQIELQKKIEKSFEINKEWNAVSAELREKRLAESIELNNHNALTKMELWRKKEKEQREKTEEVVKLEKEKSKSFITSKNLDEEIDKVLDSLVEYNFAIDIKGNKYPGKDPIPVKSKEENIEMSQAN